MSETTLQLLFPQPITITDIPEIPEEDHKFLINSYYHETEGSQHNFETTKDTYILKSIQEGKLVKWINEQIDIYVKSAMACDNTLKITQSWCLKHQDRTQQVFSHSHPNSIISGAYYIEAPEGSENIRFHKTKGRDAPFITWEQNQEALVDQPWCWEWYQIPVQTGRLVLFPSNMLHSVAGAEPKQGIRCVLSFNTWFDGAFGSALNLTELGV